MIGWRSPASLGFNQLCQLIVIYTSLDSKPPLIEGRLTQLWEEFDRRTKEDKAA